MSPEQYKPVIQKVLRDAKIANADGLAGVMVSKMSIYRDLIGDGAALVIGSEPPAANIQNQIISPHQQFPIQPRQVNPGIEPQVDVFQRVGAPIIKQVMTDEQIEELKISAVEKLKAGIPSQIACQPPGFDKPLMLTCQGFHCGQGNMAFIKIIYGPQGMGEGGNVEYMVDLYKPLPDPMEVIRELQTAGNLRYHSKPVLSAAPIQQAPIALGDVSQSFGGISADSEDRPVERFGDGFGGGYGVSPDGKPMGPSDADLFRKDPTQQWGNLGTIASTSQGG